MLLPYSTDTLMPPSESEAAAAAWRTVRRSQDTANREASKFQRGVQNNDPTYRVHLETLESPLGHDSFLAEAAALNKRLQAFLDGGMCAHDRLPHGH